ncbi:hypothetical protein [Streptomyces sp. YS415]|uniref:hypothetical protein n=1 Tax=Streptomyces sp. YS415 TaxID=2944806 RepID=UPI002021BEBA|nr:hypothetical protein [Streptomyces sp. YS415]MCL7429388.1 hypothetical protein [Streptomyces sp. YS415]
MRLIARVAVAATSLLMLAGTVTAGSASAAASATFTLCNARAQNVNAHLVLRGSYTRLIAPNSCASTTITAGVPQEQVVVYAYYPENAKLAVAHFYFDSRRSFTKTVY